MRTKEKQQLGTNPDKWGKFIFDIAQEGAKSCDCYVEEILSAACENMWVSPALHVSDILVTTIASFQEEQP